MIRKEFMIKINLYYEDYMFAEDYKLWVEIAKRKGLFYIEYQPLLYYRIPETQINDKDQKRSTSLMKKDIVQFLINLYEDKTPFLNDMNEVMGEMIDAELLNENEMYKFNYQIIVNNIDVIELL